MAKKKEAEKSKSKSKPKARKSAKVKDMEQKLTKLRKKVKQAKAEARPAKPSPSAPQISPLAPAALPKLPQITGVNFAVANAGVKYKNRDDVMLALLAPGSQVAGVFTRSATRSAPVLDCQAKISKVAKATDGAAILVNAGNANAFTGSNGQEAVSAIASAVATATSVPDSRVFTASTGVIGEALPYDKIVDVIDGLTSTLSPDAMPDAACAIMTTDTFPKAAAREVEIGGIPVQIAGIAKGSGMIAPDMATMLVYIFTDAAVRQAPLQRMLTRLNDDTFNCITVDGDTSTSDTLLLAATGKSGAPEIKDLRSRNAKEFGDALHEVMLDLAHQVVKDGEGATKFVEIQITGATSDRDAKKAAMAIANSPLVKTAIAGEDPNWGRVVMAIGKSGANADRDKLSISFGDVLVAENGWVAETYQEAAGAEYMKQQDLIIRVDLGLGRGSSTAWTCDFTKRYIEINADYRS